jgi:flagellar basal body-associated protein FliL
MKLPGGKKTILLIGLPLGLAAAGGLAFFTLFGGGGGSPAPVAVPDPQEGQYGAMVPLEERVVNLPTGGTYRYVKIGLTLELRPESADFYALAGEARSTAETELAAALKPAIPLVEDAVGTVIAGSDGKSLASADGRATLKSQLLAAARKILGASDVLNVYLTDLVMQ